MSISRFFGATSREAMRQVRMALGPDALIVSNKRVNGGVEILAADSTADLATTTNAPATSATAESGPRPNMTPPPRVPAAGASSAEVMTAIKALKGSLEGRIEEVMWGQHLTVNPELLSLFQSLLAYGFSTALLRAMLKRLPPKLSLRAAMKWVRQELDTHLPVLKSEDHLWQPGLALALVGPTGVGKTTTIAKLTARAVRKFSAENVVLITTDTYRIGAHEQLKIYADLMHVQIRVVQNAQALRQVMLELRADQVILIDNVGVSQRDKYVQDQAMMLASAGRRIQRLLALNAASHGDTLDEVARMYSKDGGSPLAGCIITKVDEASRLGASLDTALRYQLPIHYISDGQRVPENLRFLTSSQLVDMALSQSPNSHALFSPTTADLAALVSAGEVQKQALIHHSSTQSSMLKQVLALSGLSNDTIDIDQLRRVAGLIDETVFGSTAFDLWRDSKKRHQLPDCAVFATTQLRNGVLEASDIAAAQPVLFHHLRQRLNSEQAQLYATLVGAGTGELCAAPLLQLTDSYSWYANSGINQKIELENKSKNKNKSSSERFELIHAMEWVQKNSPPSLSVHMVEEHNNQLWQQWQQAKHNVMAVVPPSTRCWHVDGHSTPAAIVKQLDFYALNQRKMALPYQTVLGKGVGELSFWYAKTAIELRGRGAEVVRLQLYALQVLDTETASNEVKTFYAFSLLQPSLAITAEQQAVWLLQHLEAKGLLRFVSRAYHHEVLNQYTQQHQLERDMQLELASVLGGAAWELSQYEGLESVTQLMLSISGEKALRQTQISASLLKMFNLKDLLQQQS